MGSEVFVDVTYRGLELGRRLKLREVGPSTAYLEHGTPMPVGSQVLLATDDGLSIPVTVVRVHEQVAGAEMPPGMRVQASGLEGAAAGWWRDLVSREDPQIPELEVTPMQRGRPLEPPPMAPPPAAAEPPASAAAPAEPPTEESPVVVMDAGEPPEAEADDERPTTIMTAVAPPDLNEEPPAGAARNGNGRHDHGASRTTVMSAQEIREAIGTDPSAPAPSASSDEEAGSPGNGNGESGSEERGRGKGRGRRRRRR